jgi:hypothetical protein
MEGAPILRLAWASLVLILLAPRTKEFKCPFHPLSFREKSALSKSQNTVAVIAYGIFVFKVVAWA